MFAVNAARAVPATGHDPRVTDRHSGAIENSPITAGQGTATDAPNRDRAWWRAEARRVGSDWPGILALHSSVVATWRARHDPDYGAHYE